MTKPASKAYGGPCQDEEDQSPDDISSVTVGENIGFSSMLDSLQSLSRNVGELTEKMKRLTTQTEAIRQQNKVIKWTLGTGLAVIALLVAIK